MIQKLLQKSVQLTDNLGNGLTIEYYITEKHNNSSEVVYGVLLKKYINSYDELTFVEEDFVINLTHSYQEIKEICKILYSNEVTPITLIYVLDDIHNSPQINSLSLI